MAIRITTARQATSGSALARYRRIETLHYPWIPSFSFVQTGDTCMQPGGWDLGTRLNESNKNHQFLYEITTAVVFESFGFELLYTRSFVAFERT